MSEDGRDRTDERGTVADVSHTHPHTGETFGTVYRRGPAVADGGRPDRDVAEAETETMRDVDHTPPHGEGANEVWARGRTRPTAAPEVEADSVAADGDRPVGDDAGDE